MVVAADLLCLARDVVTDERAAEAIAAGVGVAPVNEAAVEEEHIARLHDHRLHALALGDRNGDIGKALLRIGLGRA